MSRIEARRGRRIRRTGWATASRESLLPKSLQRARWRFGYVRFGSWLYHSDIICDFHGTFPLRSRPESIRFTARFQRVPIMHRDGPVIILIGFAARFQRVPIAFPARFHPKLNRFFHWHSSVVRTLAVCETLGAAQSESQRNFPRLIASRIEKPVIDISKLRLQL